MVLADDKLILGLPPFRDLSDAERAEILRDGKRVVAAEGAVVFAEGARAGAFFLLVSGQVKVVQLTPDGGQIVAHFVAPGQFFGLAVAVGLPTYPGTAIAASTSVALSWPATAWAGLAAGHPGFAETALLTVGSYLQEAFARLRQVASVRVQQRIAHALLRLLGQSGERGEQATEIAFPVTRQDVAEMASTTLHTVSRTLHAWEDAGILSGGRRRIVIRDPAALTRIAGEA
ncbi:MAG: Crp/Fnr family transcriptional regulator [Acetobacteraceae bacterium]